MTKTSAQVVVLTFNRPALVRLCLESILRMDGVLPEDVVVIDQSPTGYTIDHETDPAFAGVRFCRRRNGGFGAGMNAGVALTNAEFVMFSNDDFIFSPQYLQLGVDCLTSRPDAACVGGVITYGEESTMFCGAHVLLQGHLWQRRDLTSVPSRVTPIDFYIGGAAIHRRSHFTTVGGFDPVYFAYYEDDDLCMQYRRRRWSLCTHPEMHVTSPLDAVVAPWVQARTRLNFARFQLRWLPWPHRLVFAAAYLRRCREQKVTWRSFLRLALNPWADAGREGHA